MKNIFAQNTHVICRLYQNIESNFAIANGHVIFYVCLRMYHHFYIFFTSVIIIIIIEIDEHTLFFSHCFHSKKKKNCLFVNAIVSYVRV